MNSRPEIKVMGLLDELGIRYQDLSNNRDREFQYGEDNQYNGRIDLWLPDYRIAIEVKGCSQLNTKTSKANADKAYKRYQERGGNYHFNNVENSWSNSAFKQQQVAHGLTNNKENVRALLLINTDPTYKNSDQETWLSLNSDWVVMQLDELPLWLKYYGAALKTGAKWERLEKQIYSKRITKPKTRCMKLVTLGLLKRLKEEGHEIRPYRTM